jgi:hypothetical protein
MWSKRWFPFQDLDVNINLSNVAVCTIRKQIWQNKFTV